MRWEYKTVVFKQRTFFSSQIKADELNQLLNEQGRQGWEMVNIVRDGLGGFVVVFKKSL